MIQGKGSLMVSLGAGEAQTSADGTQPVRWLVPGDTKAIIRFERDIDRWRTLEIKFTKNFIVAKLRPNTAVATTLRVGAIIFRGNGEPNEFRDDTGTLISTI